jgi:hypothetical protein
MPYIPDEQRKIVDEAIKELSIKIKYSTDIGTPYEGVLNYCLTKLLLYYLNNNFNKINYHALNTTLGVIESVKQEFYRRQVAPYENKKCKDNGDVY